MSKLNALLQEIEATLTHRSEEDRNETMRHVTDLFVGRADEYSDEAIGVFDVVIGRLASKAGKGARSDLAELLADVQNAPKGVIRQLALDEISVARPVLTRSGQLDPRDLVAVASSKGRDHMLAMTERENLPELVTDFLVVKGDGEVSRALVAQAGAKLSNRAMTLLVARAATDSELQMSLARRPDIPAELRASLPKVEPAKVDPAKVAPATPDPAPKPIRPPARASQPAAPPPRPRPKPGEVLGPGGIPQKAYDKAIDVVASRAASGTLDEMAVQEAARAGDKAFALIAVASLTRIPVETAAGLMFGDERDALLILARAQDWSWHTARAMLGLRSKEDSLPHLLDKAKATFEQLTPAVAAQVLKSRTAAAS